MLSNNYKEVDKKALYYIASCYKNNELQLHLAASIQTKNFDDPHGLNYSNVLLHLPLDEKFKFAIEDKLFKQHFILKGKKDVYGLKDFLIGSVAVINLEIQKELINLYFDTYEKYLPNKYAYLVVEIDGKLKLIDKNTYLDNVYCFVPNKTMDMLNRLYLLRVVNNDRLTSLQSVKQVLNQGKY